MPRFEHPQVVEKRLAYMTPEWKDAFKYATTTGDQLGHGDGDCRFSGMERDRRPVGAGFGGNEEVCLERDGGRGRQAVQQGSWRIRRRKPERSRIWAFMTMLPAADGSAPIPQFYADGPVIAYRRAVDDVPVESLHPKMTSSGGSPDIAMLTDGDLEKTTKLPIPRPPARMPGSSRSLPSRRRFVRSPSWCRSSGQFAAMVPD